MICGNARVGHQSNILKPFRNDIQHGCGLLYNSGKCTFSEIYLYRTYEHISVQLPIGNEAIKKKSLNKYPL